MNIMILGSGGRESALAWKISQSPDCSSLFIAPGNGGTAQYGTNVDLDILDFQAVKDFIVKEKITMLVVGPEVPLVEGIVDDIKSDPLTNHVIVVGPSREGAQLEGSKEYSKIFMQENNIPTAGYQSFTSDQLQDAKDYIRTQTPPIVLKADGLAAGKGVLICPSIEEAIDEIAGMFDGKFGKAGNTVVIEQYLDGIEFSVFVLTDGVQYFTLPMAKDYKRIGEGDTGLNTGGMGAVSPVDFVDDDLMHVVTQDIIKPTINGLQKRNIDYKGIIFIGLIKVDGKPYVIEYNCRLGDPETEVVLPRLKNDLVHLFQAMDSGDLGSIVQDFESDYATTTMLVSAGYPGAYEKGKSISIPSMDGHVFQAGTKAVNGTIVSNGGRVIACTALGDTMQKSMTASREMAEKIDFDGKTYRKDIGFDLL